MNVQDVAGMFSGLSRLRQSADVIMRGVENRAELAALELGEVRREAMIAIVVAGVCAAVLLLAGVAVNLLVAAIFWDTPHRVTALAWVLGIELALGIGGSLWLRHRLMQFDPFAATREQLRKDSVCLHELLPLQEP
jgi:uncharacterized membrane protein YqjE